MGDADSQSNRFRGASTTFTQVVRFLICGGLAAMANIAVAFLLYGALGLNRGGAYEMSVVIAYACGMAVNFWLNRRFTFQRFSRGMLSQARTFLVVSSLGLGLTVLLASSLRFVLDAFLSEWTGSMGFSGKHEEIAHIAAVGLVSIYSFLGHKYMTFDRGSRAWLRRVSGTSRLPKTKPDPPDAN